MEVIGPPGWQSTIILKYALASIESEKTFNYGRLGHMNGLEQLCAFRRAGLLHPPFTVDPGKAEEWERNGIKTFGRSAHHAAATDLKRFEDPGWAQSDYWIQIIPIVREYRQHIFEGCAIRIGEWNPRADGETNIARGIKYPPIHPLPEGGRDLAKQAVKVTGYLFGGVDLLLGRDQKLYVLEVNSAPAMDSIGTVKAYIEAIKRWVTSEEEENEED